MIQPLVPLRRSLHVTEDLVRRYSRRGNFHSEHATAASLGLPGLVAQGTQVTGPAYGLLLDTWGEEFLAAGELDVRFVGMTVAGETVTATVTFPGAAATAVISAEPTGEAHADADATIEISNDDRGATVVVGHARLAKPAQLP
jgi:acyl dehydratase